MKHEGNIIISVLFVVLISFLGLSLLGFSIFHTWIRGIRTQKISETGRMHQELIYYLHHFREKIFNKNIQNFYQPETDFFNKEYFPDIESRNDPEIMIKNSFDHCILPEEYYKKISITDIIDVSSVRNNYSIKSEVIIFIFSGQIPLTLIPFFLNKAIEIPEETFLEENNIINNSGINMVIDDMEMELNTSEFLVESLGIQATVLTWAAMREKFGFEVSDEPIPEGIHLLKEDDILKCMFIQGDVERLVFSVRDNTQKILIIKENIPHEYHYIPGKNYFICLDNQINEELIFKERIIVNGNIWSLEQDGSDGFTEVTDIILFASGNVVIVSDLVTKDFTIKKIKSTSLTLVSSFEKLFNQGDLKPNIIVDTNREISLQVSIITDGKLINKSPKLEVKGSIFCKDLQNKGIIEITHWDSKSDRAKFFRTTDFKYIDCFHINYIEEVTNETR